MFNLIENFYSANNLGLIVANFINLHFSPNHEPNDLYYGGDRLLGMPTNESKRLTDEGPFSPYSIFKKTWEEKTNTKPLLITTFFRKTKLEEFKKSPSWKQYKPHRDSSTCDVAGVIYFNSNRLHDGTFIFEKTQDYEPTVIIGSRYNRCVWYNSQIPHSPSMEQTVDERWTQPFFIIYKEETLKLHENKT
jgi:hypothetical protein|tara:strand:+ start:3208 stop:3780 length:573 start_codon:yes stop_codon:yes gene_type:complete